MQVMRMEGRREKREMFGQPSASADVLTNLTPSTTFHLTQNLEMADKAAKIHTQQSNREKPRKAGERKVVFKSVLENPFRIRWLIPSVFWVISGTYPDSKGHLSQ